MKIRKNTNKWGYQPNARTGIIADLMGREEGASLSEIMEALNAKWPNDAAKNQRALDAQIGWFKRDGWEVLREGNRYFLCSPTPNPSTSGEALYEEKAVESVEGVPEANRLRGLPTTQVNMNMSSELKRMGPLVKIESYVKLRGCPGVYLMQCSVCYHVLYIGKAEGRAENDLYGRLRTHAFFPPCGAVDIVIGEVLNEEGKKRWATLCDHLRIMVPRSREEIAAGLLLSVAVIHEKPEIRRVERLLLDHHPGTFGNRRRVWRNQAEEPEFFRVYKLNHKRSST